MKKIGIFSQRNHLAGSRKNRARKKPNRQKLTAILHIQSPTSSRRTKVIPRSKNILHHFFKKCPKQPTERHSFSRTNPNGIGSRGIKNKQKNNQKKTHFYKLKTGPIMLRNILGPVFNLYLDQFLTYFIC